MKHQIIAVTQFKAKCLALLDEIGQHGGTITITKRGRPLATVKQADRRAWKSPEGVLARKFKLDESILNQDLSQTWNIVRNPDWEWD